MILRPSMGAIPFLGRVLCRPHAGAIFANDEAGAMPQAKVPASITFALGMN